MTSFPDKGGKALALDATCTHSFSTSNLYSTILDPGSASSAAEDLKRRKYSQLVADFVLVPVAVETSEIIGSAECSLLTVIGRRISRATNDPRQIFQQISVAIIRGNALAMTVSSRRYARSWLRGTDILNGDALFCFIIDWKTFVIFTLSFYISKRTQPE